MVLFFMTGYGVVRYGVMTVNDCAVVRYGVIPSDWLCGSA